MPSGFCDQVKRILPLAKQVADEIVSEETKVLKELIPRMFEVMYRAAKLSCDYVKHGGWSSPWFDNILMIAARTISGPAYPKMIEDMDKELSNIIEDFDCAVNVEALRKTSKLSISQNVNS